MLTRILSKVRKTRKKTFCRGSHRPRYKYQRQRPRCTSTETAICTKHTEDQTALRPSQHREIHRIVLVSYPIVPYPDTNHTCLGNAVHRYCVMSCRIVSYHILSFHSNRLIIQVCTHSPPPSTVENLLNLSQPNHLSTRGRKTAHPHPAPSSPTSSPSSHAAPQSAPPHPPHHGTSYSAPRPPAPLSVHR